MKLLILFTTLLLLFQMDPKEETYKDLTFGFSMMKPAQWQQVEDTSVAKKINGFKLSDVSLQKFIKDHKQSILLVSFRKYKEEAHDGIIPAVQIHVRTNPTKNPDQFYSAMKTSYGGVSSYLKDFRYLEEPKIVEIDGIKSFYFASSFSMKSKNGTFTSVRSKTYAIPLKDYFFQVNFTDSDQDDCSEIFNALVKKIKIEK